MESMLKKRIIPTLLLKDGRMVKTRQFGGHRDVGNSVTAARVYDAQRADELIFLDISASREGRGALLNIIREVSEECFMPLAVGGGIQTVDQIRELLKAGADKVVVNSVAAEHPEFIAEAAKIFGSSTIVVSIDVLNGEVMTRSGIRHTGKEPVAYAKEMQDQGAGEIMITNIERDGEMNGYDLDLIRSVADAVSIPVIASGGAGSLPDFKKALDDGLEGGHASAVAAASIFHFTDQSPIKARKYLVDQGMNVRP